MIGFSDVHTRAHLYRAILEGLAYAMREGAERTARRSGVPITELRVAGGGSQSDAALQLTADVLGLPASRPHVYEASGLGAALDAAGGIGIHRDFSTAIHEYRLDGDVSKTDQALQKIKKSNFKLIFTLGSLATDNTIREIANVPIIACLILRPDNIKRASNTTGVGLEFPLEIQFKWLQRFFPRAKTIGVIYKPQ